MVYNSLKEVKLNMNEQPAATMPSQPPQAPALQYRSVGIRFVAILIDFIIISIISGIITAPLSVPMVTLSNFTNGNFQNVSVTPSILAPAGGLISVIIIFLYFTLLQGAYGQTVGKMAVKIKVLKDDGTKIGYVDAFVRTLLLYVDFIPVLFLLGAILIWTSDKKQRLGDRGARTIVVSA
jgi:uncharacterized RDD family membrane protein YckC